MLSLANVSTDGKTNETVQQVSRSADSELDEIYAALAKQTEGMDFGIPSSPITYSVKEDVTYEGMKRVLGEKGYYGSLGEVDPVTKFIFDFFTEDIRTLLDPEATTAEKFMALVFIFVKPAKAGDKIVDAIKAVGQIEDAIGALDDEDSVKSSSDISKKTNVDDFDADTASNKQKGNFGEIVSSDNLLNNQSLKDAGYDLKPIGRPAPSSINDKIVKGIDGIYENTNPNSSIKYVIDEAKFGGSQLSQTPKDGPQMSNDWLMGSKSRNNKNNRILKAVDGDKQLANEIIQALRKGEVERVLSKVDSNGNVTTFKLDTDGKIIGEWP